MVVIKVMRNTYGGMAYLHRCTRYLENEKKCIQKGGFGINPYRVTDIIKQMEIVRELFGKTSGNPLIHFMVSFDETVQDDETACTLSRNIAEYFALDYQTLWSVHAKDRGCSHYHVHIMINSVSYINGMMYHSGREEIKDFCNYVSNITKCGCWAYFENKAKANPNNNN